MHSIVEALSRPITSDSPSKYYQEHRITRDQYKTWRQHVIMDSLRGQRYGQSFCNFFNITDNIIFYTTDRSRCDQLIRKNYVR